MIGVKKPYQNINEQTTYDRFLLITFIDMILKLLFTCIYLMSN